MTKDIKNDKDGGATGIGYRVRRSTAVLALASAWVAANRDKDFVRALKKLAKANFDFPRLDDETTEILYASFDDELTKAVLDEYEFLPGRGAVRDLGGCIGFCAMCGKGDSLEHRENRDKIRYEFRLVSNQGGKVVWVGSTCIINHSLKVKGAESSAEAKAVLERSFREHVRQWRIEQWQKENPDHVSIPDSFRSFRTLPSEFGWNGKYARYEGELILLGVDPLAFSKRVNATFKPLRSAVRKYERDGHLGFGKGVEKSQKEQAWIEAKEILALAATLDRALIDAPADPDERIDHFVALKSQIVRV